MMRHIKLNPAQANRVGGEAGSGTWAREGQGCSTDGTEADCGGCGVMADG